MMQNKNNSFSLPFARRLGGVVIFFMLFSSCATQTVKSHGDFYKGLLINDNVHEKITLYEKALNDSNEFVRQAAADELAVLMSRGNELSEGTMRKVQSEASYSWSAAFDISGSRSSREKALTYLLGFDRDYNVALDEARTFFKNECERNLIIFSESETAVIEGHYSVFRLRYGEGLTHFRHFKKDNKWPEKIPEIFMQHPNLINDLGRAFQYTSSSGTEGLTLFIQWEKNLQGLLPEAPDDLRYRLLFFAGRIARRAGGSSAAQAVTLFEQALPLAPDYEQQDACIWYILDLSLTGPVNIIAERMERLIPLWYSGGYFNTIMERYLHRLVSAREWRRIITTFNIIKDIPGSSIKSGFAWVIARSIEEGYLSADDRRLASRTLNAADADAAAFMRFAYNAGNTLLMPALYYRMRSAAYLDLPYLDLGDTANCGCLEEDIPPSAVAQFLLDFFNYGAEGFAVPYIRIHENNLTPRELCAVAKALDTAGMHPQSIRIVSLYINREGFCRHRRDLELMYPRPYLELIEKNAELFDLEPALVFGLIRTESAFQNAVASHAGAVGLMQLMPATAREQARKIRNEGGPDFFDSEENIDRTDIDANLYIGSHYYNYLLNRFNNHQLALMSYNGGETRVRRWQRASSLPIDLLVETVTIYETRDYGRRVPAVGKIYEELYYR